MRINLPAAGVRFVSNFLRSPALIVGLLLLLALLLKARSERPSLIKPASPLSGSIWYLSLPLGLWLAADFGFAGWGSGDFLLAYALFRDLLVLAGIYAVVELLYPGNTRARMLWGRLKPAAKLSLFGFGAFVLLALIFWAISFFRPYEIILSPGELNSRGLVKTGLICMVIPLLEELIFRSYLYRLFRGLLGRTIGLVLASILFALLHVGQSGVVFIFLGGLLMTGMFELTGSIVPGLVLHGGFNFLLSWGHLWL